ncbi:CHRD domain-containing protein [Tolypothrix sp. PCC 7910]|uniref:CHRD domain-containing protein n=1 Tax=Tolypothrix sp. PCC 7910 TaxID=2099387 RepID=UPI0014276F96|nr:CHRD domain-containing protein [Tolypothrix sp. PCC 7910]QIR39596.1 CHRD domain-containing protein [Tolypothrix sp. PCC 7910]
MPKLPLYGYFLSQSVAVATLGIAMLAAMGNAPTSAIQLVFQADLTGSAESPANASAGTGTALITLDDIANTMRVQVNFSQLTGNTTAAHIHSATASAGTGTAGVATTTPTFPGFPTGVKSGSYDQTFNMLLSSSYNAAFITANGGTTSSAQTALFNGIQSGKAYFNIHTSSFSGGEIRGFLAPMSAPATGVPEPDSILGLIVGTGFLLGLTKKYKMQ